MNKIDIARGLIFQAMDIGKETFDDRLISQKKIYLLQEMGVNIGYTYSWYVRGPYSSELATYLYQNLDVLKEQDLSSYHLHAGVREKIENINKLADGKPETLTVPSWYELLASIQHIHKEWGDKDEFESLTKYKPQFTREQYDKAVEHLIDLECYREESR